MPFLRPSNRLLQPTCDCQTVTVNYERRHDIMLAEMQAGFYHMKSLVLALTCKSKTSIQNRGFIQPLLLCRGGNSNSVGGFYFVIFALIGAFHPKEVAITRVGLNHYRSKLAFQLLSRKEYLS